MERARNLFLRHADVSPDATKRGVVSSGVLAAATCDATRRVAELD